VNRMIPQRIPVENGEMALGVFGGALAKTADKIKLAQAEEMAAGGADRRAIWDQTGWFQGPDKQWRFEIDDSASHVAPYAADSFIDGVPLKGTIAGNFRHKPLYDAYPDTRRLTVDVERAGDYTLPFKGTYYGDRITGQADSLGSARQLLLHELQHDVQSAEGFAKGGNPRQFELQPHQLANAKALQDTLIAATIVQQTATARKLPLDQAANTVRDLGFEVPDIALIHAARPRDELRTMMSRVQDKLNLAEGGGMGGYRRLAGEVEARNVQARRDMTPEERRVTPPWETQDIADEHQIVRMGYGERLRSMTLPPGSTE